MADNKDGKGQLFPAKLRLNRRTKWGENAESKRVEDDIQGGETAKQSNRLLVQCALTPFPSITFRMRSTPGTAISSTVPLGQRISSLSILVAAPKPKWTRGSEVEP